MSKQIIPGYNDPSGAIIYGFGGVGGVGIIFAQGTTVPADTSVGYAPGCIFIDADAAGGLQVWFNEGNKASSAFKAVGSTASGTFASLTATNATIGVALTMANLANVVLNATNGTQFGTNNTQKAAFFGATPIVQPASTGELIGILGFADNSANATNMNSNGNTGTKRYSFNDVIKALKTVGILQST